MPVKHLPLIHFGMKLEKQMASAKQMNFEPETDFFE